MGTDWFAGSGGAIYNTVNQKALHNMMLLILLLFLRLRFWGSETEGSHVKGLAAVTKNADVFCLLPWKRHEEASAETSALLRHILGV